MGEIKVRVGADIGGLRNGLQNAKRDVDSFASGAGAKLESFGRSLTAALSFGALIAYTKKLLDFSGALKDSSEKLSINVENLQGLRSAFSQGGANQEVFEKGMVKLNQTLDDARSGNSKAVSSFKTLGVTWEDIQTKSPEQVLYLIADGMKNAKDPTAALSAVMDVLGKSGARMIPTLKAGADELGRMSDAATKLSAADMSDLDEAGDALERLGQTTQVWGSRVVVGWKMIWDAIAGNDASKGAPQFPAGYKPPSEPYIPDDRKEEKAKEAAMSPDEAREKAALEKQESDEHKRIKELQDFEREQSRQFANEEMKRVQELRDFEAAQYQEFIREKDKLSRESMDFEKQQYQDWLVEKDRQTKQKETEKRQQQVNSASEMISKRESEIDEELKPASQKRAEAREERERSKAGRKIQRRIDEKEKVAEQNKVDRPDIFKGEDPRDRWKKGADRAKESAGKKDKPPTAEKGMETSLKNIEGQINTLVSKINVK